MDAFWHSSEKLPGLGPQNGDCCWREAEQKAIVLVPEITPGAHNHCASQRETLHWLHSLQHTNSHSGILLCTENLPIRW